MSPTITIHHFDTGVMATAIHPRFGWGVSEYATLADYGGDRERATDAVRDSVNSQISDEKAA